MPKSENIPKITKYYFRYCCYSPMSEVHVFRSNRKHYSVIFRNKNTKNEEWHDFDTSKNIAYYLAELRESGYKVPEVIFPLLLAPVNANITTMSVN